jgi:uncharacterized protein (DUF58 family)
MSVPNALTNKSKTLQAKWLNKRFPDVRKITLGIRRIFIIPTKTSAALLLTIVVLFLMAINFQNALLYGLSFWLLALIVITIFFTYRNLSGLTIRAVQSSPCFAGEKAVFELEVGCPEKQQKSAISLGWRHQDIALVNLQKQHSVHLKLSHSTSQRGLFKPDRLTIFSVYPIGLVVAWSYAALTMQSIVYPTPLLQQTVDDGQGVDDMAEQGMEIANGSTDFAGIRPYQAGDSPKHIHWKAYAKTGSVYTKTFVDYANHDLWLEWDALAIQGVETKLSHLCAKILQYHQEQQVYGLRIPRKTIQPARGEAHKKACLTALALYGEHDV